MNDLLAKLICALNVPANWVGRHVLSFIGTMPGWLSNTIISAVTGTMLLVIFKYTSNQQAIAKVRDDIKASMLALKLFKDSFPVTLKSCFGAFGGAFRLLFHSIRPMLVMIVPVCLLIAQLAQWYQARPLRVGEEVLVTVSASDINNIDIVRGEMLEVVSGPVRIPSNGQVVWQIKTVEPGLALLKFDCAGVWVEKEVVIGDGFQRVSSLRPGWKWTAIFANPSEKPLYPDSILRSIAIDYPPRSSWTSGTDYWLIYFFIASMLFALLLKPFVKVRI